MSTPSEGKLAPRCVPTLTDSVALKMLFSSLAVLEKQLEYGRALKD
jgi:hypothetical protein